MLDEEDIQLQPGLQVLELEETLNPTKKMFYSNIICIK